MPIPVIAVSAAIELIKFVVTSRALKNKTPEEILVLWGQTRTDVKQAIDTWNATSSPE